VVSCILFVLSKKPCFPFRYILQLRLLKQVADRLFNDRTFAVLLDFRNDLINNNLRHLIAVDRKGRSLNVSFSFSQLNVTDQILIIGTSSSDPEADSSPAPGPVTILAQFRRLAIFWCFCFGWGNSEHERVG
jgi:hypothetical protein